MVEIKRTKYDWIRPIVWSFLYFLSVIGLFLFGHWLIGFGLVVLYVFCLTRYIVNDFDLLFRSFVVNSINYFRYKKYNYPVNYIGSINCYTAHTRKVFGCGKTLSAVILAKWLYDKYNGKETYEYTCKEPHWIKWKVEVYSNVDISGIPVIPLESMQQLVDISNGERDGIFTVVVIDEANAFFNGRFFKTNFQNEEQIRTIVTCRHNNIHMMFTGQRFKKLDKLIRDMCDCVVECEHSELFNTIKHSIYSAYDLENCDNPNMVECIGLTYGYVYPDDYHLYDTKALVGMIAKEPSLSSSELVERKGVQVAGIENVRQLSAKGRKLLRKKG